MKQIYEMRFLLNHPVETEKIRIYSIIEENNTSYEVSLFEKPGFHFSFPKKLVNKFRILSQLENGQVNHFEMCVIADSMENAISEVQEKMKEFYQEWQDCFQEYQYFYQEERDLENE